MVAMGILSAVLGLLGVGNGFVPVLPFLASGHVKESAFPIEIWGMRRARSAVAQRERWRGRGMGRNLGIMR